MGFDCITNAPLLLSHGFFFVFGCRISFFGIIFSLFIDCFLAIHCDFDIFIRGDKLQSFSSTIVSLPSLVFLRA